MKKVLSLALACAMALSLFGCAKKPPTAEELVANSWFDDMTSLDADLKLNIEAEIQAGDAADELGSFFGGADALNMGLSADIHIARDDELLHCDGAVSMSMFGMSYGVDVDEWAVTSDDGTVITYSYDSTVGTWITDEANGEFDYSSLFGLDTSAFTDLVMTTEDDAYVVTGKVSVPTAEESGVYDIIESVTGSDVEDDFSLGVVLKYDKSSRVLRSLDLTIDADGLSAEDGARLTRFEFGLVVNKTSGVSLEIPADVPVVK